MDGPPSLSTETYQMCSKYLIFGTPSNDARYFGVSGCDIWSLRGGFLLWNTLFAKDNHSGNPWLVAWIGGLDLGLNPAYTGLQTGRV